MLLPTLLLTLTTLSKSLASLKYPLSMIGSSSGSLRGKNSRLTSQGRVNQKCSAHLSFTYKQEMRKTTAAGAVADLDM